MSCKNYTVKPKFGYLFIFQRPITYSSLSFPICLGKGSAASDLGIHTGFTVNANGLLSRNGLLKTSKEQVILDSKICERVLNSKKARRSSNLYFNSTTMFCAFSRSTGGEKSESYPVSKSTVLYFSSK
jgi:hypothetical protein